LKVCQVSSSSGNDSEWCAWSEAIREGKPLDFLLMITDVTLPCLKLAKTKKKYSSHLLANQPVELFKLQASQ
jgi:hypothetical protein